MLNFKDFCSVNEGFYIEDDVVYFDPNVDNLISTSFGKFSKMKPYTMKTKQGVILSVYRKETNLTAEEKELYTEVLKAIKGQSTKFRMDRDSYSKFINRTAIYFKQFIREYDIDTILTMGSSSGFVGDVVDSLQKKLPPYYTMMSFRNAVDKNPNFDDISLRQEEFGLGDETVRTLMDTINRQRASGKFSIKGFPPQFRKTIKDWLKLNDQVLSKVIDKRVVLFDDVLTTGSTLIEASNILEEMGAEYVLGITVIKGTH